MKECQHCKTCYTDEINSCPNDGMPTLHTIAGEPILEDKYHLENRVGQGGMGVVYKARHAYLKTLHAIKIILPDLVGNDPELVTRFRQEALAAAAIRHQNVVQVTDYGVAQGTMPFLVMEFVEGEDLNELLEREKRLKPEVAFELVSAICKGIGAAHAHGIVHRDMKPLNIMILKDKESFADSVKILDFGLAKIKSGELLGSFIQAQTTGLMGSPFYMAPEQWSDDDLDASSDIYSIGVMLYQMLTGDVPFKGSSIPAIMKKHLSDPPPTFAERGITDISPEVESVVMQTLAKDREERISNVQTLVEKFGKAIGISTAHVAGSGSLAGTMSQLSVLTNPPQSKVYVDDVSVGESKEDGWITLNGLQTGNHLLRVSHSGFPDWESEIVCDGKPKQIVADLRTAAEDIRDTTSIPKPVDVPVTFGQTVSQETPTDFTATQQAQAINRQTAVNFDQTNQPSANYVSQEISEKKWFLSPLVIAIIGITGLLLLTSIGGIGLYLSGYLPGISYGEPDVTPAPSKTPEERKTPPPPVKAEMIEIPGGEFMMGRNDGLDRERPEHKVKVDTFLMDKTEVTNSEYNQFVQEADYKVPPHFVNGKPAKGTEMHPVIFVTLEDAREFAKWRSNRDGVKYRLPTEEEWEYAARNGSENNLYPWGDAFKTGKAVIGKLNDLRNVGGRNGGANKWGIQDLIGNVWEWTDSEGKAYPNSQVEIAGAHVIRGGGFYDETSGENAITSTFRGLVKPDTEDKALGFRLVRSAEQ